MNSNMEVPNQATKIAGGEGSQITDTQPANSPKLTTPLEFHQAEEIKRLENTVADLKENLKELTGTVRQLLKKIENCEPNSHRTKNSEKPLGTSADYSHRNQKNRKAPQNIYSLMNEDEPENQRFFYHAEFENEARRKVNPYSLRKRLHEQSGLLIPNNW